MRVVVALWGAALILASFLMALIHPFDNPQSVHARTDAELLEGATMTEPARNVLRNQCADCHSEMTHWPLYAHVAPFSWLIERDVARGRESLDLSAWPQLSEDRRQVLEQEIVHEIKKGEMPPLQYRLVHWSATLSAADVAALASLVPQDSDDGAPAQPGDAARGQSVFERGCTGCHALNADREGPHLRGVYGRKVASVPGFGYSEALKKSDWVWDDTKIEIWLRDTDAMVPNSAMGFSVPKAQDRADLVTFLKSVR